MSAATPQISVIVPAYNAQHRVERCLRALAAQRTDRVFETIVVDDGSTDDTGGVVTSFEGVRLVRQHNAGPGAARNRGVQEARAPLIFFTDDDCEPEPDWIEVMAKPFDDPEVVGVKGAYRCAQRSLVARFVQVEYEEKYDFMRRAASIDFIDTYSAGFRRQAFLDVGGFDASFTTASTEDQELSFRLARAGHRMVFVPEARVWHQHVETLGDYVRKKHKIGFWKVLTLRRNPERLAGDTHTPLTLRFQVAVAAGLPLTLPALLAGPVGALIPAGLVGLGAASAVPLTVRCLRRDPPVAAVAPLMIAARAVALASGLARGTAAWLREEAAGDGARAGGGVGR